LSSNRKTGLDLVRAFAILFVPAVHFFLNTNFYSTPLLGGNMYLQAFLRMTFLICVPLFMILTGYLQVDKTPTKKYFKKIIPILVVYLIYSLIAIVVREFYFKEHKTVLEWFAMILNFKADSYSWYINMYIGLFLLSPYLNIIYKNIETKKQKLMLIAIFLFITAVPSFFNLKVRGILYFPDFWAGIYPITYYFIGSFIREFQVKIHKVWGFAALVVVNLLEMFIEVHYSNGGVFKGMSGYYSSLIVVVSAVLFFLVFYDVNIKTNFIAKTISLISILSLDIYLASNVTDRIVYDYVLDHLFKTQQQILYFIIPVVCTTFFAAFFISYLRHKLIRLR
jgi:surface polysaccharide O-acyltransferase-like enzyme